MNEITGPDDANFGIISLCVITGILGTDIWLTKVNPGNYLTEPVPLAEFLSIPVFAMNIISLPIQLAV